MNVVKIRGSEFRDGYHDFILKKGGMAVFPRLVAGDHHRDFARNNFPSGIKGLDSLLGGGLGRGTTTMFMGPPGTGKSTMAVKFALTAAERGEKVLLFIFDETIGTLMDRARHLGMDLEPHVTSGMVVIDQVDPAEISPGEMTSRIRHGVEQQGARMIVLDSINGYLNTMPVERDLTLQLHELLAYLNQQGVVSIMILAQQGLIGVMQSTVDLTYLADTVVLMRYFEARGEVKQAISVIKKRNSNHERAIREITVGKDGIVLGEPLRDLQGVLSGVPSFMQPRQEGELDAQK